LNIYTGILLFVEQSIPGIERSLIKIYKISHFQEGSAPAHRFPLAQFFQQYCYRQQMRDPGPISVYLVDSSLSMIKINMIQE